jgi:7,8-dihydropterin-6-yl-methyl-4-(beta-D-ribofuranosyl)aminobenzene 5'-phosphate synthase
MGGLHLGGVMESLIPQTVEGLQLFDVGYFIAGHCTGWRALHALANAYGERVSQSAVGTRYHFAAETPPTERVTPPQARFTGKPSW